MSSSEFKYLYSLYELANDYELVRIVDLSRKTSLSKASVYHALERLIKKGYASKEENGSFYKITALGISKVEEYMNALGILKNWLIANVGISEASADDEAISLICSINSETRRKLISYCENK